MSRYQNGKIPKSSLVKIPGGYLQKEAAVAWRAMRAYIISKNGPSITPGGPVSSYRSFSEQKKLREYWCGMNMCYKAAIPGKSNHGNGTAVDVSDTAQQDWIRRVGSKFGWSDEEGKRVGERWHFNYVGGYVPQKDPLSKKERTWLSKYLLLRRQKKNVAKRRSLLNLLTRQRKKVFTFNKNHGWTKRGKRRYNILKKYTIKKRR